MAGKASADRTRAEAVIYWAGAWGQGMNCWARVEKFERVEATGRESSGSNPCVPTAHLTNILGATMMRRTLSRFLISLLLLAPAAANAHDDLTVDQLKARVSSASVSDKVHLCVQIAEKQLDTADKLYTSGDLDQAQPALTDVVAFSELARDYSIQSKKHQKQTEISVRAMTRKLTDILHLLGHEDQAPVRDAITRLEKVRDDLLTSMFPKGVK